MNTSGIALINPDWDTLRGHDVLIVGSGAAAMAAAGELRMRGISSLLIEAGPPEERGIGRHARTFDGGDQGGLVAYRESVEARLVPHAGGRVIPGLEGSRSAHNVGGMLSYWSHIAMPPHPVLERESAYSSEEFSDLLERAGDILHVSDALTAGGTRQRHLLSALSDIPGIEGEAIATPLSATPDAEHGFRFGAGDDLLFRDPGAGNPGRVSILPGHVVRRILWRDDTVTGLVAFPTGGGDAIELSAAATIVAAGAIGTPQLLHASGLRTHGVLGGYLTDHPMATSRVRLKREYLEDVAPDDALFSVTVPVDRNRTFQLTVSRGWHASPGTAAGDPPAFDTADVNFLSGIEPAPENALVFDDEQMDGFGLPAVSARLALSSADRTSIHDGLAVQHEVASRIGVASEPWVTSVAAPGGSLHLLGTHRMGAQDDGTSVTDRAGRPWGYAGIHLVGNRSISARTACNPTLTTVALSLAAADSIAK